MIELHVQEQIPVRYAAVDLIVPQLLDSVRPDLTIHVGEAPKVPCFVLEKHAKRKGYVYRDDKGQLPANYQNVCDGPDSIATPLDIEAICHEFNGSPPGDDLQADTSDDAGLYVCEYIYFTSLYRYQSKVNSFLSNSLFDKNPTLFVHVPINSIHPNNLHEDWNSS